MKGLIFLIIYLFSKSIMAQNIENKGVNDCRIDTIIAKQIKVNKFKRGVDGYRVQIHHNQSQSREESQKFRSQFSSDFPHLKTYLEFKSPYYKIQVGDFADKLNAYKVQKEISLKYAGAYIVKAVIPFEEIIKPTKASF
mgnify:CR=1 FL=1|tara:strand:- start:49 stop:465 length:417 start_codon:yes stop_codon:yes gene_type:complete